MYRFNDHIITHVPTSCLVEDYQALCVAIHNQDWVEIETVKECLAECIERFTTVPDYCSIKPSGSSLIAMSCDNGILTDEKGYDLLCAGGKPVSHALSGGCDQCADSGCPWYGTDCVPENVTIRLQNGYIYTPGSHTDEKLLAALERV